MNACGIDDYLSCSLFVVLEVDQLLMSNEG